mmetsp:Transcript_42324/g.100555  ORF Transcript_42324/g.100555 Transcript_42324/m.100555 type:complete len:204 (-) Transcript_42324:3128-3739(-)
MFTTCPGSRPEQLRYAGALGHESATIESSGRSIRREIVVTKMQRKMKFSAILCFTSAAQYMRTGLVWRRKKNARWSGILTGFAKPRTFTRCFSASAASSALSSSAPYPSTALEKFLTASRLNSPSSAAGPPSATRADAAPPSLPSGVSAGCPSTRRKPFITRVARPTGEGASSVAASDAASSSSSSSSSNPWSKMEMNKFMTM